MELIFKLPPNKPPFIGVLFDNKYTAITLNRSWVDNYNTHMYKALLQINGSEMDLTITEEGMGFKHRYEELKYDLQKLHEFLRLTKEERVFNFGHIITEFDNHKVVRTSANNKLFVLKVDKVKFEWEE